MRKLYYLLCMVAVVVMAACTNEEEDLFNDSSANRADAMIKANTEVLTGASNGWLMEYFPESLQKYGGYNLILSFNSKGEVKVAGDRFEPTETATSLFSVKQSAGIMLSFDTYNEIFHFFSDPTDPGAGGGNGSGYEGDYDFLILEATPEKVILKGKKAGGIVVLTPMKGTWEEYIAEIQKAEELMGAKKYRMQMGTETIEVSSPFPINRTLTFSYSEGEDSKSQTAAYVVRPTGYQFYSPITIKGKTIEGFTYNAASDVFTAIGQPDIQLVKVIPSLNEQFISGNWFVAYSTLGAFGQANFNKTNLTLTAAGEQLGQAFIGSSLYKAFGFNFISVTSDGNYGGLLGLNYTLTGEDKISLVFSMTGAGNGVWYHNNMNFHFMLNVFGYSAPRTFTLTTDNVKSPTYIILTEEGNPDNVIKLYASPITFPFDH